MGTLRIWSVAIGTRHIERAYQHCVERGTPSSNMQLIDWNERDGMRAFLAEVAGTVFEVMRVKPATADLRPARAAHDRTAS